MSVKVSLTPAQSQALLALARAGAEGGALTGPDLRNGLAAIGRLERRMTIHRVPLEKEKPHG